MPFSCPCVLVLEGALDRGRSAFVFCPFPGAPQPPPPLLLSYTRVSVGCGATGGRVGASQDRRIKAYDDNAAEGTHRVTRASRQQQQRRRRRQEEAKSFRSYTPWLFNASIAAAATEAAPANVSSSIFDTTSKACAMSSTFNCSRARGISVRYMMPTHAR